MRRNWHNDLVKLASNERFKSNRELFWVVYIIDKKVKGDHQYQPMHQHFYAANMKQAMQNFQRLTARYVHIPEYNYALVSRTSRRVLVTSSAYSKDFDYEWNQDKNNKRDAIDEKYNDWTST
jgi:hypothetical protein